MDNTLNIKNAITVFTLYFLISCSYVDNNELLSLNLELKRENDSLRRITDSLHILPFIDNTTFETTIGEVYRMHLLGVVKDEIQIQELIINGEVVDTKSGIAELEYDEYGAFLTFKPDSEGVYEFRANSTFEHWDDNIVPLSWSIEVSEK